MNGWRFYVYELLSPSGAVMYVGKGSGNRLACQVRDFQLNGHEVARFKSEKEAYAYEVRRIADVKPMLNKHAGGNGSRASKIAAPRLDAWDKCVSEIGTRVYAAQLWLAASIIAPNSVDLSKTDKIRQVAYG